MADPAETAARNPVGWFEIYCDDLDRATAFYEAVFGVTLDVLELPGSPIRMRSFPMSEEGAGAAGALVKMEGVTPGPGGTLNYFSCDDCGVEAARVAPAGGKVFKEKESIGPFGFIALAYDTEGNTIGLHSHQ